MSTPTQFLNDLPLFCTIRVVQTNLSKQCVSLRGAFFAIENNRFMIDPEMVRFLLESIILEGFQKRMGTKTVILI